MDPAIAARPGWPAGGIVPGVEHHLDAGSRTGDVWALVVAFFGGLAIAWIDAGPRWDDTGITVGLLLIVAAVAAFVSTRRPWLSALLVGVPTPVVEIAQGGDPAIFVTVAFAALGATAGYLLRQALRSSPA